MSKADPLEEQIDEAVHQAFVKMFPGVIASIRELIALGESKECIKAHALGQTMSRAFALNLETEIDYLFKEAGK